MVTGDTKTVVTMLETELELKTAYSHGSTSTIVAVIVFVFKLVPSSTVVTNRKL